MDLFNTINNTLSAITNNSFVNKLVVSAGAILTAYITPIAGLLTACFFFTTVDLFYGIKIAKKAGRKLTSSKSWKGTLTKLQQEFTIITLAHLLEYAVMGAEATTVLSGGATVLICLTELWSILENLNTLNPDGPWKVLKKYLKKKGEDLAGIELDEHDLDDTNNTLEHKELDQQS